MASHTDNFNHICDYLRHWAKHTPDSEAAIYKSERLNWDELLSKVESLACQLLDLGVKRGDRVALLSPARNEYLISYLATIMIGGIWYGLHPRYQRREIKYLLDEAKPNVVITVDSYLDLDFQQDFEYLLENCDYLRQLITIGNQSWPNSRQWSLPEPTTAQKELLKRRITELTIDDSALIVFTSGTTGEPKGALLSHRNVLATMKIQNRHFGFNQSTITQIPFPINHVACSTQLTTGSIIAGSKMIFLDKFDPAETLKTIEAERVTHVAQIPTMFLLQFAEENYDEYDHSSVEHYIWAGSSAPVSMVKRLRKSGVPLLTGYGMTESTGFVTFTRQDASESEISKGAGIIDTGYELKIVDSNRTRLTQQQLLDGEIGEISLRGDCIMQKYWNRAKQTAEVKDENGWYYTGDIARQDAKGNIFLVGRSKEMFISGGFNIYPKEIEMVIEQLNDVAMVSVIGVNDPTYQEVGKALLVAKHDVTIDLEQVKEHCRAQLANFKVPKYFELVESFPLLPNGKLDKKLIVKKYS